MDITNYEERLEELNEILSLTSDEMEELDLLEKVEYMVNKHNDIDALQAWVDLGHDNFDNFDEAYQGQYGSDEDFAQELCEDCGDIPKDLPGYIHIDWERTAGDIMVDYEEENGYYFRIF
jgi:antirestriction protein